MPQPATGIIAFVIIIVKLYHILRKNKYLDGVRVMIK